MGPLAQQLLGLVSALTYTYLDTTNPSERITTRTVGLDQLHPVLREYSNRASPFRSECPNCDCSGNESNPECVWGCRDCKWQCKAADSNDCRWNCGKCGWDCTVLETEWIDAIPPKTKIATLHSLPNFQGDEFDLGLDNIGDCAEFWNPDKAIPHRMGVINDVGQSIRLADGVCVRLYENDCEWRYPGKTMEVTTQSPWASQFSLDGMKGIVSSVKRIVCPPPDEFTIYKGKDYTGKSTALNTLKKIGDHQVFNNNLKEFNDNTLSIRVNRNTVTCLRLYEHGYGNLTGRVFDVIPNNNYVLTDLSINSFSGIISAVEIIECPVDSTVVYYTQPQFKGNSIELRLYNIGDCVEFWNHVKPVPDRMKVFNHVGQSIRLPRGVCVRLDNDDCTLKYPGRTLDISTDSPWASQFSVGLMNRVSSVERVECQEFTIYTGKYFTGPQFPLTLKKVGDCQELNNNLKEFNDNTLSIRVNRNTVTCLRLYEHGCGDAGGRTLDVAPNNSYVLADLSLTSFSNIISSVGIINCP